MVTIPGNSQEQVLAPVRNLVESEEVFFSTMRRINPRIFSGDSYEDDSTIDNYVSSNEIVVAYPQWF